MKPTNSSKLLKSPPSTTITKTDSKPLDAASMVHMLPMHSILGSSSLTITAIDVMDKTSKPLPSVSNNVTITNIEQNISPVAQTHSNNVSPTSKPIANTNSANATKGDQQIDLSSPSKRATDHSINSIISSPPQGIHSTDASPALSTISIDSSSPVTSPVHSTIAKTHIINLDSTRKVSVLARAAEIQKSSKETSICNSNPRSLAPTTAIVIQPNLNSETIDIHDSSSGDEIEFVSGTPVNRSKSYDHGPQLDLKNVIKKSSINKINSSRADSPKNHISNTKSESIKDEVDVNQIMKDLKELEVIK